MCSNIVGYKGFHSNFTGYGNFQFEVGNTYRHRDQLIGLCESGFHFCVHAQDVLEYYNDIDTRYAVVEVSETIKHGYNKSVCSCIKIIREITLEELYKDSDEYIKRPNGIQEWFKDGKLHREGDQPSVIGYAGSFAWHKNGKLHREGDRPAIICENGDKFWFREGKKHRENDRPAVIKVSGDMEWYDNGRKHREGDLPACIQSDGTRIWYYNGDVRRDGDLPAIIYGNGDMEWFDSNGVMHRDGGLPARVCGKGTIYDYYINGVFQRREYVKKELMNES
jgi:antitoxin component YwqK of YwqJK toxin-antitoxin module